MIMLLFLKRFTFIVLSCLPFIAHAQKQISVTNLSARPAPNYTATRNTTRLSYLSDNKYSDAKIMWTDSATLGWQNAPEITINFELKNQENLSQINMHTVQSEKAHIFLPLHAFIFLSADSNDYTYAGDMMSGYENADNNFDVLNLTLDNINREAKYVMLKIIPNGQYFFTDEIDLYGNQNKKLSAKKSYKYFNTHDIETFINQQKESTINKKTLQKEIADNLARLLSVASKDSLLSLSKIINSDTLIDSEKYKTYQNKILLAHANIVNNKDWFRLAAYPSAWGTNMQFSTLKNMASDDTINVFSCTGADEYIALNISNASVNNQTLRVSFPATGNVFINIYDAQKIESRDFQIVPDALIPVPDGDTINFKPGESKVLLINLSAQKNIDVTMPIIFQTPDINYTLPIHFSAADIGLQNADGDLNVNTWAYFNYPLLKGKEKIAQQDLLNHFVNVVVIPPAVLLKGYPDDFNALNQYLPYCKGFKKVLLYLELGKNKNISAHPFLSEEWKTTFLNWYDKARDILIANGFDKKNIFLYPYDEPHEKDAGAFIQFSSWIKTNRKDAKIYTTISSDDVYEKIKNYADIMQLIDRKYMLDPFSKNTVNKNIWIYDTQRPAKSLSPYQYYRLMAWKAFQQGFGGIGFWNYADATQSAWNDFDGNIADYNVVYNWQGTLISSRRWEAFKMGIEDYKLLSLYAKKIGRQAALNFCDEVLKNANDFQQADNARREMIKRLSR